ncbi:lysozyme inhibitor LprI family protein [Devosia sp. YIM 151766]|uniref:DUF3298 domain-containing protein n=1 Tax=Devosia sp. YIM 151766 TaxID=3017325 RepID=UPI00255CA823|nr:DUF3298 domain-containing protein [Devosia sp. YIM 151766]WIY52415.1 lysozyme inhibitor LprI family protein [Devosia sp. YIM 151766]
MIRFFSGLAVVFAGFFGSVGVTAAASFDCAEAATPFEQAICNSPDLSAVDERLAATYETATGGLSESARGEMRIGQREWLSYAQRACTSDATPLAAGAYDERGIACLVDLFTNRSKALEQSRMIEGLRFYPVSRYAALPDPRETGNPDSWWPVARHEFSMVQLDSSEDFAAGFNEAVQAEGERMAPVIVEGESSGENDDDNSIDTNNSLIIQEVAGTGRISLKASTYWYGHGAAHGNWGISYRHYLIKEGRFLEAQDLFAGAGWQEALIELALAAARLEHGDNLMLDDISYLSEAVVDPTRWNLSDAYALVIQFQPYEISAYAYGAPEARVRWSDLEPYLATGAEEIRYGF